MSSEILKYVDWKTGKKKTYNLGNSLFDDISITDIFCPFDNTPLIFRHGEYSKYNHCVNCGEDYPYDVDQEQTNECAKMEYSRKKSRLEEIEGEDLIARIDHAEKMGIISK